ncbi:unnamed protein product, partial [Rotaria socialis]
GEAIDADVAVTYVDTDDVILFNEKSQINNTDDVFLSDYFVVKSNAYDYEDKYKSNYSLIFNENNNSNRFHTLKKRVVTRWNTVLIMHRSYADNIHGVEAILSRLKCFDLILTKDENQFIQDLIEFLSMFESTTTILSASKSYPTISLCLLLRMEIESLSRVDGTESLVIQEMKSLLSENFNNRFPLMPLYICAFLLDPS